MLCHILILLLALFPEGLVLKRQTVSDLLDHVCGLQFGTVAPLRGESLQLDGSLGSKESERGWEALVLEGPDSGFQLVSRARVEAAGAGLVTGAQAGTAVVNLRWGIGARQGGDLRPGLSGEAVPPQAVVRRVLALAPSKKQHAVPVGHRRVAHQPGGARPGWEQEGTQKTM